MMAVRHVLGKDRTVARMQNGLAILFDQHRLAIEHYDEFVDTFVPVPLARPGAGLQYAMADADILEPGGLANAAV